MLDIATDRSNGETRIVVIHLRGRIDALTAPEFEHYFEELLRGGTRFFLLRASGLEYVSSSGIASLIQFLRRLSQIGGAAALCEAPDEVRLLLEFFGLNGALPLCAAPEDARELLREAIQRRRYSLELERGAEYRESFPEEGTIPRESAQDAWPVVRRGGNAGRLDRERVRRLREDRKRQAAPRTPRGAEDAGESSPFRVTEEPLYDAGDASHGAAYGGDQRLQIDLSEYEFAGREEVWIEDEPDGEISRKGESRKGESLKNESDESAIVSGESYSGGAETNEAWEADGRGSQSRLRVEEGERKRQSRARQAALAEFERPVAGFCESCGQKLRVYRPGVHLCPACGIEFDAAEDRTLSFFDSP